MDTGLHITNRFVAMFDIIGFKALRAAQGTEGLFQLYTRGIIPAIHHSAAGKGRSEAVNGRSVYVPDFDESSVQFLAVSDTVIFYTKDDSFQSFLSIVRSSAMLLQLSFNGSKAPFRGAIGWGDLIVGANGFLIGSSIEDAYAAESCQAWAGVILTERCRDFAVPNGYIELFVAVHEQAANQTLDEVARDSIRLDGRRLVRYNVPTQENPKDGPVRYGTLDTFAIDWTIRMYEGAAKATFNPSDNSHAQAIARNTDAFETWARANNR